MDLVICTSISSRKHQKSQKSDNYSTTKVYLVYSLSPDGKQEATYYDLLLIAMSHKCLKHVFILISCNDGCLNTDTTDKEGNR